MLQEPDLRARVNVRDGGLRRLKTVTGVLVVAMSALAGIFAGMAAATTAAHKLVRLPPRTTASHTRSTSIPAPPSLPPLGSQSSPTPSPPAQPPVAAPPAAAPVVVSGGS